MPNGPHTPAFKMLGYPLPSRKRDWVLACRALIAKWGRAYSFTFLSRSALLITDTELKLMAAAAMMGLRRIPNLG